MAILTKSQYIILQKCKLTAKQIQNCTNKSTFKLGESFFFGYRTPLVVVDGNLNAQKYREDILGPHVVPLLQAHNVITTLQQDNATSHVDCVNLEYLRNHKLISSKENSLLSL